MRIGINPPTNALTTKKLASVLKLHLLQLIKGLLSIHIATPLL